MWSARKTFLMKKNAAIKIQRELRARKVRKLYLLIIDAVVFIQSVFRGYRVRKELKLAS
jgi:myosin heavy subunit